MNMVNRDAYVIWAVLLWGDTNDKARLRDLYIKSPDLKKGANIDAGARRLTVAGQIEQCVRLRRNHVRRRIKVLITVEGSPNEARNSKAFKRRRDGEFSKCTRVG